MQVVVGIDIGGTKCAISFARLQTDHIDFLDKVKIQTWTEDFDKAVIEFTQIIQNKFVENPSWKLCSIGISCGGPLNAVEGIILAPPNLPKWENADIFTPLKEAFGVPVMLQNDADACALAEWSMGAGKGSRNMIFLTFGTGMGAGLILNNELYSGTNGLAGEVGHIRMEKEGPLGYGKYGSFEGFCSGGGIANLGIMMAEEAIKAGKTPAFCKSIEELNEITCEKIADAQEEGDPLAKEIFQIVAKYLGMGLAILIDILNPEVIAIGSIYARQESILIDGMREVIDREALSTSNRTCKIVPASLGERIGDYAAVSVGIKAYSDFYNV